MSTKCAKVCIAPQIVGNAGLYYVCHQLSLLGWNTLPTSRNAKGVDLICYNSDCSRKIAVQVKSLSKRNPVPLGKTLDSIIGDVWVIVNNLASTPTAFVMFPDEVTQLAHRGEKNGKVSYWLQPKAYDCDEFRNAWERISPGHDRTMEILAEFFGPVKHEDLCFCNRHQDIIFAWMHGLLTVSPDHPKRFLNLPTTLRASPTGQTFWKGVRRMGRLSRSSSSVLLSIAGGS